MLVPLGEALLVGTSDGLLGLIKENHFTPFSNATAVAHYAAVDLPKKAAFLTGDADGHLRVYGMDGTLVLAFPAHQGPVYRLVRSGELIWSASRDKSVKAWHVEDLRPIAKIDVGKAMQRRSVNALSLALRPERQELLAGGDNRMALVYQLTRSGYLSTNPPPEPRETQATGLSG